MAFDVRLATPADHSELLALLSEHMPGVNVAKRHSWLYAGNPGGRALTWLAIDQASGTVAGCTSFFPFRLWLNGDVVHGALGGDGYVRPAFRRRGLGAQLHDASRRAMIDNRIECMYGAPGAMNVTPLKNGGSREVGSVARWVRPISAAVLPRVPAVIARISSRLMRPRWIGARLDPMLRHDPRVDALWAETRRHFRLAAIRDASFYTWRFMDAPAGRQQTFVIVSNRRPIAACALERVGHALRIVDLVAAPNAWRVALRTIFAHAADCGAAIVDIKLFQSDGRGRALWQSAMLERDAKPFLVMVPAEQHSSPLLDPSRWFYTSADADLDAFD
jgi:GNAT superfamily N-acetyltransferase